MTIYQVLAQTQLPCVYSHFKDKDTPVSPPYIAYIGAGQDTFEADNTIIWRNNRYQIEYYYTKKDESNEAAIENALISAGYNYEKSDDVYIEDENVFVIYYSV